MAKKKKDIQHIHPIDKMVHEGLQERSFPFEEEAWEKLQPELEAYNASRRGRGFGFIQWFLIFLVGAVVITESIFLLSHKRSSTEGIHPIAFEHAPDQKAPDNIHDKVPVWSENNTLESGNTTVPGNENANKSIQKENTDSGSKKQNEVSDTQGLMEYVDAGANNKKNPETTIENEDIHSEMDPEDALAEHTALSQNDAGVTGLNDDQAPIPSDPLRAENNAFSKEDPAIALYDQMASDAKYRKKEKGDLIMDDYLEISGGILFTQSALSTKDPNLTDWVEQINAGETMRPGTQFGLDAGLQFQHLTIGTGLHLLNIRSDYSYTVGTISIDTSYEIIYDSILYPIDTITYFDTTDYQTTSAGTNLIHQVEIPLLIGYTLQKNNWKISLQTGPSISFITKYEISRPDITMLHTDALQSGYLKSTSFSWVAKPSVFYSISDFMDIGLLARFRWNLGDINTDPSYSLRYTNFALQAGLRFHF